MRVALVRGPQLNPFEMQTYMPLVRRGFDFTAFTSEAPFFERPMDLRVERLPSPMDDITQGWHFLRPIREMVAYRRGTANRLEGLEERLGDFDVVHSAETFNAYSAQAAKVCARTGIPLVLTVWENIPFLDVEPAFDAHRKRVVAQTRAFVAVSDRARQALLIEGVEPSRIHVVPVGIDLESFRHSTAARSNVRDAYGIPEDAVTFLFAGRLTWEKGLFNILHAMRLNDVEDAWPGASPYLLVVGDGEQRAQAEHRVETLGLTGRVHFAGSLPYDRMPSHYAAADALVLSSVPTPRWQEQYGMVLVEAMASGLPIIASASGSIPEVVGEAAMLVQAGDAWTLSQAMADMGHPNIRKEYARRGRARAEKDFDREKVAQKFADIYRSVT